MGCMKIETPIGTLLAKTGDGKVRVLELWRGEEYVEIPDETTIILRRELEEYFRGERRAFSLPVDPAGTPFQKAVWQEMGAISYGNTRTYGEIAKRLGKKGASRAVGQACHVNPVLLLLPCHRVVAAGGLGGFALGEETKKFLLALEQGEKDGDSAN